MGLGLSAGLLGHDAADVDQVVGNHPEADPALDSGIPLVPAAIEAMPSFDHADASSQAVRHFWPLRNQRFFCSRLRSGLLVERLGMQTRLTPLAFAAASFLAE